MTSLRFSAAPGAACFVVLLAGCSSSSAPSERAATTSSAPSAAAEAPAVPLFNGKDLSGWVNENTAPDTWTVKDGMIVCNGKPNGFLRTEKTFRDFVLEMEWQHRVPKGNAGLFVWAEPHQAEGVPFPKSIEVQIMDGVETPNYTSQGDVFSIHGAKMTPDRPHPAGWERCLPSERRTKPAGEWNRYRVTCKAGTLKLEINGREVSGGYDIEPRTGHICLEAEGSEVWFRNLTVRELP
jgi:hypothetical protein